MKHYYVKFGRELGESSLGQLIRILGINQAYMRMIHRDRCDIFCRHDDMPMIELAASGKKIPIQSVTLLDV